MLPNIVEDNIYKALGDYITSLTTIPVIRSTVNRVSEPVTSFVSMSPGDALSLSTNVDGYNGLVKNVLAPKQYSVQIDCYGASSNDTAMVIQTLFRDQYAIDQFASSGFDIVPLYATDIEQMPIVNGEDQYEKRYMFKAVMQYNPIIELPQDSATLLGIGVLNVDREFPA